MVNAAYVKLIAACVFLTKRLEVLQIVDYNPKQEGKVFFGAWVELENEEGEIKQYRIVGCDEFAPAKIGYPLIPQLLEL